MSKEMVNAWIFLNEDEPSGTTYGSPTSCYQRLIDEDVYQSVDLLSMCFVETVPTSDSTVPAGDGSAYTIQMGAYSHNQPYMENIIRDAPKNNPDILLGVTLLWGQGNQLSQIFPDPSNPDTKSAEDFAANLVEYLTYYKLRAFCIDWESPLSDETTEDQFSLLIDAIGTAFRKQDVPYYLTIAPASVGTIQSKAAMSTNNHVNWLTLQLYSGFTSPDEFTSVGINADLFAYGAKFESEFQTAKGAYEQNNQRYHYPIYTNWRLNSGNYIFEQDQQKELYKLVFSEAD